MTPQDLEQIERAFDKAKMAGPQALHDWATTYAPQLTAQIRAVHAVDAVSQSHINDLRALYPGVQPGVSVVAMAVDDITSLRAERARLKGTVSYSDDPAHDAPAFNYGDPRRIVDALRPFAALGAPICLTALEEHRILNDVPDDIPAFAVPDPNGPGALASVTAEQLKAAHDLINEIDGGTGA